MEYSKKKFGKNIVWLLKNGFKFFNRLVRKVRDNEKKNIFEKKYGKYPKLQCANWKFLTITISRKDYIRFSKFIYKFSGGKKVKSLSDVCHIQTVSVRTKKNGWIWSKLLRSLSLRPKATKAADFWLVKHHFTVRLKF